MIETTAAAQAQPNPALIFETLNAHQRSSALRGAIELDLFTHVAEGARRPETLAGPCSADPRAVRILCDFLVVNGFLTKAGAEYGLTPTSAAFLDRRSLLYMGEMARFINSDHLLEAFRDVAALVRHGGTLLQNRGTTSTEYDGWVDFARCMVPLMLPAAEFLGEMAASEFSGPVQVLDVAAGHGMFGISVAQLNPQATIVALDWPRVLEVAQENAVQAGVSDRFSQLPGDALELEYGKGFDGQGFDLVLVTNFFHHFDAATCLRVMRKISAGLTADGAVYTLEFVPNADRVSPPQAATFSFTMLGTTPAGDAYTFEEYDAMWREAGLTQSTMQDVPNSAQRVIVTCR